MTCTVGHTAKSESGCFALQLPQPDFFSEQKKTKNRKSLLEH